MRRSGAVLLLGGLLVASPVWALDLVRIATIPRGHLESYGLPVGDLNHNGWQEVVFEQSVPPFSANIWEHWGSNSYQPAAILREGCGPAVGGDPDEDGLSDLLCQWGPRAFLLESRTPATFPSKTVWEEPLGGFPGLRGYFVDSDQDGQQEMWIVPNSPDVIEVWENRGNNRYVQVALLSHLPMSPETLAFGDFDGDGRTEIVVGTPLGNLFVWENTGDDAWALVWTYRLPFDGSGNIVVAARDLDGDGKPEFLVGGRMFDTLEHFVMIFEAAGDDTYAAVWQRQQAGRLFRTLIAVGDVDGDGQEEFAAATSGAIQLYTAFGDNDFRLIGELPYADNHAIALADLNGNGAAELIFNGAAGPDADPSQIHIYELADLQPPVLIPAWYPSLYRAVPGLSLPTRLELFDRTAASQTVDAWVEVYRGSGEGGPSGPLLSQEVLLAGEPLAPQTPLSQWVAIDLPRRAGLYTLQLKVGTFPGEVVDTRWFTVNVGLRPPWQVGAR